MASPNLSEIAATSLQGYSGKLADNVTNHNALLNRINRRGNIQIATGRSIVQELEYAENATVKWYSGAEVLDVSASDVLSAAEFSYKQLAGNVVITGLEEIQNSGREAVHNLLKSRIKNLERSLKNAAATAVYADGTGTSGKEIGGLQHLIADLPTSGVVGGIDRGATAGTFYRNQYFDFSGTYGSGASSTLIPKGMRKLWLQCMRGADKPDMILMDENFFTFYWESLSDIQRITSTSEATAGWETIKFVTADVFYDDQCPASHGYFLNTDYLHWRPAKGRNFVPAPDKASVNQDAMVMPMYWAGNMTVSNPSLQGVLHN